MQFTEMRVFPFEFCPAGVKIGVWINSGGLDSAHVTEVRRLNRALLAVLFFC